MCHGYLTQLVALVSNPDLSRLVLREIEQEDTLWQQRKNKEPKQEPSETKMEVTQHPEAKESSAPATLSADEQTTETQSNRKMNFF